jgi:hypothetical protein
LWLVPNIHVSPSSYEGFWVSTPISAWVFSLMCHMVWGEKCTWDLFLLVLRAFYNQRVLVVLQRA